MSTRIKLVTGDVVDVAPDMPTVIAEIESALAGRRLYRVATDGATRVLNPLNVVELRDTPPALPRMPRP